MSFERQYRLNEEIPPAPDRLVSRLRDQADLYRRADFYEPMRILPEVMLSLLARLDAAERRRS